MKPLTLLPVPAFNDNYLWVLHDGQSALVVDPGDATPVAEALNANRLQLETILVTHHHGDHTGGVAALQAAFGAKVYAPANDPMPFAKKTPFTAVDEGSDFSALGCRWQVMAVPGHTLGHIAYFAEPANDDPILFCGDTLFSGGCGRLFEGTPAQMHQSLTRFAALSGQTRVCCAHEYTLSNLKFARAVEPENEDLMRYSVWCEERRDALEPTLPSRVEIERQINPFLRVTQPAVVAAAQSKSPASPPDPVSVLGVLREWKNNS
jgi:hydroxyacylglutathione hydrolase